MFPVLQTPACCTPMNLVYRKVVFTYRTLTGLVLSQMAIYLLIGGLHLSKGVIRGRASGTVGQRGACLSGQDPESHCKNLGDREAEPDRVLLSLF